MAITSTGNASLDALTNSYQTNDNEKAEREDALGTDAFLTMLVAQLQNQDPLNPMDGTDFSAQLAQFSQLEQLMNLNDSMDSLAGSFSTGSEKDLMSYLGKQVSGNVDSMQVENGAVSGGFFNLYQNADVIINITDASGETIKTLHEGTQASGAHLVEWDGTDEDGKAVEDGTYKYSVLANTGSGYEELPTNVTGTVDGVAYSNGNPYLVVQGVLIDPDSLTSVYAADDKNQDAESVMSYLGRTITSDQPILSIENGVLSGEDIGFTLEQQEGATIKIYDPFDNLVQTLTLDEATSEAGENSVLWNATGENGYAVDDGLYYYTVQTASGTAKTAVSEEVSGIKYANGSQYLELKDTGRLVAISSITAVN
jgi:flagellar basal-body rod modification protein FlgD